MEIDENIKEYLDGDIKVATKMMHPQIYTTINAQNNDFRTFILLGGQGN